MWRIQKKKMKFGNAEYKLYCSYIHTDIHIRIQKLIKPQSKNNWYNEINLLNVALVNCYSYWLKEVLFCLILQAENLRKKVARMEDENDSLMMQLKKMATRSRSMISSKLLCFSNTKKTIKAIQVYKESFPISK